MHLRTNLASERRRLPGAICRGKARALSKIQASAGIPIPSSSLSRQPHVRTESGSEASGQVRPTDHPLNTYEYVAAHRYGNAR